MVFVRSCAYAIRREHGTDAERFVDDVSTSMLRAGDDDARQTWLRIREIVRAAASAEDSDLDTLAPQVQVQKNWHASERDHAEILGRRVA
jgi:hypothetical protein